MPRATGALFVLSACNETFELHPGSAAMRNSDASFDAASAWPAAAPPSFSRDFDQLVVESSVQLTIGGLTAGSAGLHVAYGELGSVLVPDATLVSTIREDGFDLPRRSADGTLLTLLDPIDVQRWDVAVLHRDSSVWTKSRSMVACLSSSMIHVPRILARDRRLVDRSRNPDHFRPAAPTKHRHPSSAGMVCTRITHQCRRPNATVHARDARRYVRA